MITARESNEADPHLLAPKLRHADVQEVEAVGQTPLSALVTSYEVSSPCYTIIDQHDNVIGMFGVAPGDAEGKFGVIWMLASDDLAKKHSIPFIRQTEQWIENLHKKYSCLSNLVDSRNVVHIRWLKWCGANFLGEHFIGKNKIKFLEFVICK